MRQLEKVETAVLRVIIFAIGCGLGFLSGIYSETVKLEREFGNMKLEMSAIEPLTNTEKPSIKRFNEGALTTIFTADRGELVGVNTYLFTNPLVVDLYPGTKHKKSEMSSDYARIEFAGADLSAVKSSSWWGNFKRRSYINAAEPVRFDVPDIGSDRK
jgi:hypothetical protein